MVKPQPLGGGKDLPRSRYGEEDADVIPIHVLKSLLPKSRTYLAK